MSVASPLIYVNRAARLLGKAERRCTVLEMGSCHQALEAKMIGEV
jgi:hypothetical protein